MAAITFKAKPQSVFNMDDTLAYQFIKVPTLARSHCDMAAFRKHPKFGGFANSDLFPNVLRRIASTVAPSGIIRLDRGLPAGVTVDASGFLATVTIEA